MTNKILKQLEDAGFESYAVGGCVRDELLNRVNFDVDITTSARPDEIKEVFKDYKIIDIGAKFGTIKVLDEDSEYEITTMRRESGYSDKRHPEKIAFTDDIKEDLKRRDFTINAMAKRNDQIIDLFDGKKDLKDKIIRAVGDPNERIKEDVLRSLRAVRFATTLNFDISDDLKKAIRNNAESIEEISKERIQVELNKILLADDPRRGILLLDEVGLLEYIFPEVFATKDFDQHSSFHSENLYDHTLSVLEKTPPILEVRMAALYHDVGKIDTFFLDENGEGRFFGHQSLSEELLVERLKKLKYSRKFIENTSILVKRHMDNTNTYTKKSVRKLLRNIGEENLLNLFKLQRADVMSTKHADDSNIDLGLALLDEIKNDDIPTNKSQIKINGNDLKKLGFKEGKELGRTLENIENLIYDEKLKNNKEDIINYINSYLLNVD
ncbi:HD domain-containing protein [Anaerococcus sp. mt242]|uniref:CCA tRNA nucleotidyltransferase n=1 Tax=Anaerococcus sp. mt242 TaxID=2661917 RepID=UPI001931C5BC|nr:HD domain-containing protein [Anaerococcus sp. mt242]MBM0046319.1 HD domain-containing protein [Anaerococcus sp. mt242]